MLKIANAPCSWGTLEFEGLAARSVGYQQMLDELVETGYHGTDLGDWGFMPTDPSQLRAELSQRDLTMLSAFVPIAFKNRAAHEPGARRAVEIARLLAAVADIGDPQQPPFIVLADDNASVPLRTENAGRITPEMGLSAAEWAEFAAGVRHVAQHVRAETGLAAMFHHHCAGYVETPAEIERFLTEVDDPELISLVFDTGHYAYGDPELAGNAIEAAQIAESVQVGLNRFAERIGFIHFKDCQPQIAQQAHAEKWDYLAVVKQGLFCELGQGGVDFGQVINWLEQRNYAGWAVVEQDVLPGMGSPKESAQRNRDYLRSIGV